MCICVRFEVCVWEGGWGLFDSRMQLYMFVFDEYVVCMLFMWLVYIYLSESFS